MRSRSLGPVAIVVVLIVTATAWWQVGPGTGTRMVNAVRYKPYCAKLPPIPNATASPSRGSPYYLGTAEYRVGDVVTVYFDHAEQWRAHGVEFERRIGSQWVPVKWAQPYFHEIVVEPIRAISKRYPASGSISWDAAPLKALSFAVTDFDHGRWRACFAGATEEGGTGHNVFAYFTVTGD